MAINTMLKLLEDLENTSKNWRLTANNYDKNQMKKLVNYASTITGEKVTKDYIKDNFKTFHSAIKYYTNIEKKLVENKENFIENYEYNLKFLIKLTNDNLARIRKAKKEENPSINEMYTIVSNFLTNARDFKRAVLNEKDVFMGIDTDIKEKLSEIALTVSKKVGIVFASIDIVELSDHSLLVLEANSGVSIDKCTKKIKNGKDLAKNIYKEAKLLLTDKEEYDRMSKASNPYGDGHASEKIVDAIIEKFTK